MITSDLKLYDLCRKELNLADSLLANYKQRQSVNNALISSYKKRLRYQDSVYTKDSLLFKAKEERLKARVNKYKRHRTAIGIGAGVLVVTLLLIN
jgi:hypothetical protein